MAAFDFSAAQVAARMSEGQQVSVAHLIAADADQH
jgi:hypothetical protein